MITILYRVAKWQGIGLHRHINKRTVRKFKVSANSMRTVNRRVDAHIKRLKAINPEYELWSKVYIQPKNQ